MKNAKVVVVLAASLLAVGLGGGAVFARSSSDPGLSVNDSSLGALVTATRTHLPQTADGASHLTVYDNTGTALTSDDYSQAAGVKYQYDLKDEYIQVGALYSPSETQVSDSYCSDLSQFGAASECTVSTDENGDTVVTQTVDLYLDLAPDGSIQHSWVNDDQLKKDIDQVVPAQDQKLMWRQVFVKVANPESDVIVSASDMVPANGSGESGALVDELRGLSTDQAIWKAISQ